MDLLIDPVEGMSLFHLGGMSYRLEELLASRWTLFSHATSTPITATESSKKQTCMTHEDRALDYVEHVLVACNRTLRHIQGADEARFLQDYTVHDAAIHAITVAERLQTESGVRRQSSCSDTGDRVD